MNRKGIYYVNFLGLFHFPAGIPTISFLTRTLSNLKIATADPNYIMLTFLSAFISLFLVVNVAYGQPVSNSAEAGQNIAIEYPVAVKILASKRAYMEMMKLHQKANELRDILEAEGFNKNYVKNTYGARVHDSEVAKRVAEMEQEFYERYPDVRLNKASRLLKDYDFERNRTYGENLYIVQEANRIIKDAYKNGYLKEKSYGIMKNLLKKFYSSRLESDESRTQQLYQLLIELLEDRYL